MTTIEIRDVNVGKVESIVAPTVSVAEGDSDPIHEVFCPITRDKEKFLNICYASQML